MLIAGGAQADASDNRLSEDEAADFLRGGRDGMAEQQGRSTQVEFDLFVGRLVFPSPSVEPDEFESWMGLWVQQIGPEPDGYPAA